MPQEEETRNRRRIQAILALLVIIVVIRFFSASFPSRAKGSDFPEFYAAATIVLQGQGHQLYNPPVQEDFQQRCCSRVGTYFNHPAYEALIYAPLAMFSPERAYFLWCCFNGILLILFAILIQRSALTNLYWPLLALLPLAFPPLLLNFFQGQDSLLLLVLVTASILALRGGHQAISGILLACGLFKFHLVLPLLLLFLCLRKLRALLSFALTTVVLFVSCIAICGVNFLPSYIGFLREISQQSIAGLHPAQMANLRGLVIISGIPPSISLAVIALLSVAIVVTLSWICVRTNRPTTGQLDLVFTCFCLATLLASYHLSPHDLTLLLFPLALVARYLLTTHTIPHALRIASIATLLTMFLPPLYIVLVNFHLYSLAGIPVIILLVLMTVELRRTMRPEPIAR